MRSTENFPDDKFDLMVAVMLSAPFHLTKRCLPDMKKKGIVAAFSE
jgi:NAD(P)-dependent dehydrogenase (short-subunit alcohol dehydrogenase family)